MAGSVERTIDRGDYDLEEIRDGVVNVVELYGLFRTVRKSLLENSPPRIQEALRQADARMKAARLAGREAEQNYRDQALRGAERNAGNVAPLSKDQHRGKETREQAADTGA